jgi:hypothetical protein
MHDAIFQAIFIFYCVDYMPIRYGKSYTYPRWAEGLGFCMSFASMIWVPAYAVYYVLTTPGSVKEASYFSSIYGCDTVAYSKESAFSFVSYTDFFYSSLLELYFCSLKQENEVVKYESCMFS